MTSQIRNGGKSWTRLKSPTLNMTFSSKWSVPITTNVIYLRTVKLWPPGVLWIIGHLLFVLWTQMYIDVCIINYNIQPRLTLLKVCRHLKGRGKRGSFHIWQIKTFSGIGDTLKAPQKWTLDKFSVSFSILFTELSICMRSLAVIVRK